MRETIYKCDICKAKGDKDTLVPFYVNGNGCMQFLIEMDNSNNYMCGKCIGAICEYKAGFTVEKQEGV